MVRVEVARAVAAAARVLAEEEMGLVAAVMGQVEEPTATAAAQREAKVATAVTKADHDTQAGEAGMQAVALRVAAAWGTVGVVKAAAVGERVWVAVAMGQVAVATASVAVATA